MESLSSEAFRAAMDEVRWKFLVAAGALEVIVRRAKLECWESRRNAIVVVFGAEIWVFEKIKDI